MTRFAMTVSLKMHKIHMGDSSFDGMSEDEIFARTIVCRFCDTGSHVTPAKLEEMIAAAHNGQEFLELADMWNFQECGENVVEKW
jgi:hypothetical protein